MVSELISEFFVLMGVTNENSKCAYSHLPNNFIDSVQLSLLFLFEIVLSLAELIAKFIIRKDLSQLRNVEENHMKNHDVR